MPFGPLFCLNFWIPWSAFSKEQLPQEWRDNTPWRYQTPWRRDLNSASPAMGGFKDVWCGAPEAYAGVPETTHARVDVEYASATLLERRSSLPPPHLGRSRSLCGSCKGGISTQDAGGSIGTTDTPLAFHCADPRLRSGETPGVVFGRIMPQIG